MKFVKFFAVCFVTLSISSNALARPAPDGFADLVEELMPSVVNISTSQTVEVSNEPFSYFFREFGEKEGSPLGELPELLDRFYNDRKGDAPARKRQNTSLGSGFIISKDGYIVTNNHVVEQADEVTVIFSDEIEVKATVVGTDPKTDIALLKIDTNKKLIPVNWGDSDKARVGSWVIAIGNPYGLGGSVSAGIVSARGRDINVGPFDDFLQTDAAINRGNSGGPLFNVKGEVVGINSAIFSPSGGSVGIGFSVSSNLARPVIEQLKDHGRTFRGWLGVKIQTVTEDIAESLGMDNIRGALVLEVVPDSPAEEAGILSGDVIIEFDGKEVEEMRRLPRIVAETKVGKKVAVVVLRQGKQVPLAVTIAELEEENAAEKTKEFKEHSEEENLKSSKELLGLKVVTLSDFLRERYSIAEDVEGAIVLDVDPQSDAAQKGVMVGDVIKALNQQAISSAKEAVNAANEAQNSGRKSALLLLQRGDSSQFIALKLNDE